MVLSTRRFCSDAPGLTPMRDLDALSCPDDQADHAAIHELRNYGATTTCRLKTRRLWMTICLLVMTLNAVWQQRSPTADVMKRGRRIANAGTILFRRVRVGPAFAADLDGDWWEADIYPSHRDAPHGRVFHHVTLVVFSKSPPRRKCDWCVLICMRPG